MPSIKLFEKNFQLRPAIYAGSVQPIKYYANNIAIFFDENAAHDFTKNTFITTLVFDENSFSPLVVVYAHKMFVDALVFLFPKKEIFLPYIKKTDLLYRYTTNVQNAIQYPLTKFYIDKNLYVSSFSKDILKDVSVCLAVPKPVT